jgi:hypothetical protein
MRHPYTSEQKEKIAQIIFNWINDYAYYTTDDVEKDIEDGSFSTYAEELILNLVEITSTSE